MSKYLIHPKPGCQVIEATPDRMGWAHLRFEVLALEKNEQLALDSSDLETAIVAMSGCGVVEVGGEEFELARQGVFDGVGSLLYVAPDLPIRLAAQGTWVVAAGAAPAGGRYPTRMIAPAQVKVEVRGGGAALRQVNHLLAPPLPAERLIVYEVFVPAGSWAGWPPHCHDGLHGSPYLEETYYFRFDRPDGFGFHRNYLADGSYDEVFTVRDGDCVAVPRGFHVTTAAPGHNMWILNFLAGELIGEDRAMPPYFDPSTIWITENWSNGRLELPHR